MEGRREKCKNWSGRQESEQIARTDLCSNVVLNSFMREIKLSISQTYDNNLPLSSRISKLRVGKRARIKSGLILIFDNFVRNPFYILLRMNQIL